MKRRQFLGAAASAVIGLVTRAGWAGSYLDRAALMLDSARKEIATVKTRTGDKELLLVVKTMTEARLKVARKMNVPAKVVSMHPHLMLVLENYDRAIDSLISGNNKKYAECLVNASDEEKIFKKAGREDGKERV